MSAFQPKRIALGMNRLDTGAFSRPPIPRSGSGSRFRLPDGRGSSPFFLVLVNHLVDPDRSPTQPSTVEPAAARTNAIARRVRGVPFL